MTKSRIIWKNTSIKPEQWELDKRISSAEMMSLLDTVTRNGQCSAVSIGVIHDGSMLQYHEGTHADLSIVGLSPVSVDAASLFDVASITKSIVALLVMWAESEGLLKLEDKVSDYIPGIQIIGNSDPTIQHLLNYALRVHLDDWKKPYTDRTSSQMLDLLQKAHMTVGDTMHYSNYPPILLNLILKQVTNKSLKDLFDEVIAKPLRLHATFDPDKCINTVVATELSAEGLILPGRVHDELTRAIDFHGAAGLFATCTDMLRIAQFIMDKGYIGNTPVIKSSIIDRIGESQFLQGPRFGLGWGIWDEFASGYDPMTYVIKAGKLSGFSQGAFFKNGFTGCQLAIFPAICTAVAVMTNHVHPRRKNTSQWINKFRYSVVMYLLTGSWPEGSAVLWK